MTFHLRLATLSLLMFSSLFALSQGTVRGVVSDELGEPLPFVNVYVKDITSIGTTTDLNGLYTLNLPDANAHVVVFSSVGMAQQNLEVTVKNKEVFVLNVKMLNMAIEIEGGAEIIVKANRGGEPYMEILKKENPSSIDYISASTFKKTGDTNVPDAVKRISGVSTVGGYVSVRGLSDRYIKTTINGSRLPTLDPFTNNIRMDMFPTGLIDNVIISKTMTPDLPGDWSGAFISIETKDYPEELQINFTSSVGYNSQTTFKDIVTSQRSSTDWLGFDNGFRDIPEGTPTDQSSFPREINPSLWQQFDYLGISGVLEGYGIPADQNIANGSIGHQIGLSELGFLGPGQFNNSFAVQNAISEYNQTYAPSVFFTAYNQELENIGTSFKDTWFTVKDQAPLNSSISLSIGNQTKLFKRPLGFVIGFRHSTTTEYDPDSDLNRTNLSPNQTRENTATYANLRNQVQQVSRETTGWSGLASLTYNLNPNNKVSLLFMPNFQGQNKARKSEGFLEDNQDISFGEDQVYEERQQLLTQFNSEHLFPESKIRINTDASYTKGKRNLLDFKDFRYLFDGTDYLFNSTFTPDRRFRYMDENLLDTRVSIEIPVLETKMKGSKLKFGGAYQYNTRENQQVVYTVQGLNESDLALGFDDVMSIERFRIVDGTSFDLSYNNTSSNVDSDLGFLKVAGGFGMFDLRVTPILRFVGGLRVEHTDMLVDIKEFYENNYAIDDPRRSSQGQLLSPGEINQVNFLPSINIIYKLKDDEEAAVNLRANFSQSLARPSFRELTNVALFDYELFARVKGNTNLEMTSINNYDLRCESFFKGGSNLSASVFYKTFKNHIELILAPGDEFTWQNAESSQALGFELEGKVDLTKKLELRANVTFIRSETTVTIPVPETRTMFGQAPYIFNAMLSYRLDSIGLIFTGSYNIQGPKLALVASSAFSAPDVFELPRNMVDLKVSKRLGEHFSIAVAARNLLNATLIRAYRFENGYDLHFDSYQFGTVYNFSVSYDL
ncbi:MAG: outer membrane beta-barrel protein [Cryomorphaceae bacterium]|nr:outer membrane beta-barrel protein [Cryomorphaceae bacterium]